jgi:putative sterol carrier protein
MEKKLLTYATPQEFLDNLPSRFKPEKAAGVNAVVQVELAGDKGGIWTVTIQNQKLTVTKEGTSAPTFVLKMKDSDFLDLVNEKVGTRKMFLDGKIRYQGNISTIFKLKDVGFL